MPKYEKWLTPEGLTLLEGWARDGLTDEQIAAKIGIHKSTLYDWKDKYSDFSEAIKKGKEVVDTEVENALLKRALGFEYYEEVEELRQNRKTGEFQMMVVKRSKKTVPPDTVAQIFWLKNRKPEAWREKAVIDEKNECPDDGFLQALTDTAEEDWDDV